MTAFGQPQRPRGKGEYSIGGCPCCCLRAVCVRVCVCVYACVCVCVRARARVFSVPTNEKKKPVVFVQQREKKVNEFPCAFVPPGQESRCNRRCASGAQGVRDGKGQRGAGRGRGGERDEDTPNP